MTDQFIQAIYAINRSRENQGAVVLPYDAELHQALLSLADRDDCSTFVDQDGAATGESGATVHFFAGGKAGVSNNPRWCVCLRQSTEPIPAEEEGPVAPPAARLIVGALGLVIFVTWLLWQ